MNKRRRYDIKNKRGLIIILIVAIVIVGVFSLFIYRYNKASKILYVIEAGSVIQDVNKNYLTIDDDAKLKIRWNGNYYLSYDDKNVNLGKKVITYNALTGSMNLYGTFYEIGNDGKIVEFHNENKLSNTTTSRFYKLDDREYLLVDTIIHSEDNSIEATNYLLVELDKAGNAKLTNNKLNLKTISPTKLVTSDYEFDIANEVLKFGEYSIDLKKIIGSTNEYKPEEIKPDKPSGTGGTGSGNGTGTGTGSGTGSGNGSGSGTGSGSGVVVPNDKDDIPTTEELLNKVKMTSIIRIVEGITTIDVDYVIYDPFNEYTNVEAQVIGPGTLGTYQLKKTETHLSLTGLSANTEYKLKFIYTTTHINEETGEIENIPYTFDSFDLKTKMPEYKISVYKISTVSDKLTYKVDLQSGYSISKINVDMEIHYKEKNTETEDPNDYIDKVMPFEDQIVDVPSDGATFIKGDFDITDCDFSKPETLLKLTVKSVFVTKEDTLVELPINSTYVYTFGR